MFYPTTEPHGLRHNPYNGLLIPRPIGWISTIDKDGNANLAPYSFFNGIAYTPPQVMFSSTSKHSQEDSHKDTVRNILETGQFVHNLATYSLREAVNLSSIPAPHGVDEFELAGVTKAPSELVQPPRVAESPVHLECELVKTVELPAEGPDGLNVMVIGKVIGIHIDESVLSDGLVDVEKLDPIARLGYRDYARVVETFSMTRPDWP